VTPVSPPRYFDDLTPARRPAPDYFSGSDRPRRANSKKHEKDIAKRTGDRQVPGSGNQPGRPGDVTGKRFLRDGKATVGAGITLKADFFRNIASQAQDMGRVPIIEIRLEGAKLPVPSDWVCLPASDFDELAGGDVWRQSRTSSTS
jgi:hypothetical protein